MAESRDIGVVLQHMLELTPPGHENFRAELRSILGMVEYMPAEGMWALWGRAAQLLHSHFGEWPPILDWQRKVAAELKGKR